MSPLQAFRESLEKCGLDESEFVAESIKRGFIKPGSTLESLSLAELAKLARATAELLKKKGKKDQRLGGGSIVIEDLKPLHQDQIYQLSGMNAAVEFYYKRFDLHPVKGFTKALQDLTAEQMLNGTPELERIMEQAEKLIDRAIEIDPRLAKKPSWVRGEEGLDGCAALIASGDDRPFFDQRRTGLADRATVEPCRVVISTDSKTVNPANAAAFIAAAKISQQFRPLELWWQGAWLLEEKNASHGTVGKGHIIHVPLIQGDLDFRRLQFVLCSQQRDAASFNIMLCHALPAGLPWGGGVARWSYLPDTTDFVRETGINPDAEHVAENAARWAGMEPLWETKVSAWEASQYWNPTPSKYEGPTDADRRRWKEENEAAERERQRRSAARLADVG